MNIPVSNFRRDEAYTFITGMAIATTWYLYLVKIKFISEIKSMIEPFSIMLWLLSTATLYILYLILTALIVLSINDNLKKKDNDKIIEEKKLIKYFSLYYSGPLEEIRTSTHILGLITISLFLLYLPLVDFFITLKVNFILIHLVYTIIVIFVYYQYYKNMMDLLIVKRVITSGFCDTIDEKEYNKKRAELYAILKNNEYIDRLKNQNKTT